MEQLEEYKKKYWVVDTDRYSWIRSHAPEGKKIVDIGSCYGWVFNHYNKERITSVDLDDYSHTLPNFVRADARKLPFEDKSFDIAVLGEILEHQPTIEDVKKVLSEALRVAEKVIITVPNEYLWKEGTEKFKSYERELQENDYDMTAKAHFTAKYAKDIYSEDEYKHIFHHHHFSPEDLSQIVSSLCDKDYYIYIMPNDGDTSIGAAGTTGVLIE